MAENEELRNLPSTDQILGHPDLAKWIVDHGRALVKHAVQHAVDGARARVRDGAEAPDIGAIVADVMAVVEDVANPSLKRVVNATGVILHTNLGRAPLAQGVIDEIASIASGYCNLEFDLAAAGRGKRTAHVRDILRFLTSAEDVLVVNNNAAGILLALNTLARGREVVISRGELIEIGGSFRLPDVMAASGARMVEVGTTNRTRLSDYEAAIGDETALLVKVHKSNYSIRGFTEEVLVKELAELAHARGLPVMYDVGSGLLGRPEGLDLGDEPHVAGALADGADLVAFSCDKLLGGPQAGILAGRGELVSRMAGAPLMRALRVGKLTLAALSATCRQYLRREEVVASIPTFAMLARGADELERLGAELLDELKHLGVAARAVASTGGCGGGSLPDLKLNSVAVEVLPPDGIGRSKSTFPERLFARLLKANPPVLGVLREGRLLFDMLTVFDHDIARMARAIAEVLKVEVAS